MEQLFQNGSRLPFTKKVMIEEQAFLDIIDQMRIAIPEEMLQAKRITEERERLLADAEDEAERIRVAAQEHAGLLLSQDGLMQVAESKASRIVADAQIRADQLMSDADEHCISVLSALEADVNSILVTTRNGIQHLQANTLATKPGTTGNNGADGQAKSTRDSESTAREKGKQSSSRRSNRL
jgi:hypothetical protein